MCLHLTNIFRVATLFLTCLPRCRPLQVFFLPYSPFLLSLLLPFLLIFLTSKHRIRNSALDPLSLSSVLVAGLACILSHGIDLHADDFRVYTSSSDLSPRHHLAFKGYLRLIMRKTELLIFILKPVLPRIFLVLVKENSILPVMSDEASHLTFWISVFHLYLANAPISKSIWSAYEIM